MYKESNSLNNKTKQTATPETCTKKTNRIQKNRNPNGFLFL